MWYSLTLYIELIYSEGCYLSISRIMTRHAHIVTLCAFVGSSGKRYFCPCLKQTVGSTNDLQYVTVFMILFWSHWWSLVVNNFLPRSKIWLSHSHLGIPHNEILSYCVFLYLLHHIISKFTSTFNIVSVLYIYC